MNHDHHGVEFVRPRTPHNAAIHLVEADPEWTKQYAEAEERIRRALDGQAAVVEHVGSTSVPGLAAKPIIDILLLVTDPADEARYVPGLEQAGYALHIREPRWYQHRLLRGTDPAVNLHVFAMGSPEAERMRLFRDRLRTHPEDRERYEKTKRRLAARQWRYVQDYAEAKSRVVEEIIASAKIT